MKKLIPLMVLIVSFGVLAEKSAGAGSGKASAEKMQTNKGLMVGTECPQGDDVCKAKLQRMKELEKEKAKARREQKKELGVVERDRDRDQEQDKLLLRQRDLDKEQLKLQLKQDKQ